MPHTNYKPTPLMPLFLFAIAECKQATIVAWTTDLLPRHCGHGAEGLALPEVNHIAGLWHRLHPKFTERDGCCGCLQRTSIIARQEGSRV